MRARAMADLLSWIWNSSRRSPHRPTAEEPSPRHTTGATEDRVVPTGSGDAQPASRADEPPPTRDYVLLGDTDHDSRLWRALWELRTEPRVTTAFADRVMPQCPLLSAERARALSRRW